MARTSGLQNQKRPPSPAGSPPPYTGREDSAHKKATSSPGNVVIIGDLGKVWSLPPFFTPSNISFQVALGLTKLLAENFFNVTSVISEDTQAPEIKAKGVTLHVLSLKDDAALEALTALFTETQAQIIYITAGEGDKAGPEGVHKAAYEDALMVFNAVEAMDKEKPHVILVSSIDTRNPHELETFPPHYDRVDKELSAKNHAAMKTYFKWRYKTDEALGKHTAFHWTILRPGELIDGPGKERVEIGRTHLKNITVRRLTTCSLIHFNHLCVSERRCHNDIIPTRFEA